MLENRINIITEALYLNSASVVKEGILNDVTLEELFELSLYPIERTAFRSAWSLEHIFLVRGKDFIVEKKANIINVYCKSNNWSVLRSFSKLIMRYLAIIRANTLPENETEQIINKTFELLEDNLCPIAVRCNCYDILYLLSTQEDWLIPSLKQRMEFDLSKNTTPALKSRANAILKKLQ